MNQKRLLASAPETNGEAREPCAAQQCDAELSNQAVCQQLAAVASSMDESSIHADLPKMNGLVSSLDSPELVARWSLLQSALMPHFALEDGSVFPALEAPGPLESGVLGQVAQLQKEHVQIHGLADLVREAASGTEADEEISGFLDKLSAHAQQEECEFAAAATEHGEEGCCQE